MKQRQEYLVIWDDSSCDSGLFHFVLSQDKNISKQMTLTDIFWEIVFQRIRLVMFKIFLVVVVRKTKTNCVLPLFLCELHFCPKI